MANSFGSLFRITTFGESHGPAIGVVVDGCPSGLSLSIAEINEALALRSPGKAHTSPRKEKDEVEVISGLFEGKTTGAPIALLIRNTDADSSAYESIKHLYRPGHANFTYQEKYGVFDYRGGGRASARETAARVAAGVIAKKLLAEVGISCVAFISELGSIPAIVDLKELDQIRKETLASPLFCPDDTATKLMIKRIEQVKQEGDSLGAIITCVAEVPPGLGDPVYSKLEANLASAMLSIPASKGFEIGAGFAAARMKGSEHNDPFFLDEGKVRTKTNFSGGTLAGISTGSPLYFRVAFKPTSSIRKAQQTVTFSQEETTIQIGGRHDPCVAIRAVPVVEAMCALVLADAWLNQQTYAKTKELRGNRSWGAEGQKR